MVSDHGQREGNRLRQRQIVVDVDTVELSAHQLHRRLAEVYPGAAQRVGSGCFAARFARSDRRLRCAQASVLTGDARLRYQCRCRQQGEHGNG